MLQTTYNLIKYKYAKNGRGGKGARVGEVTGQHRAGKLEEKGYLVQYEMAPG